MNVQEVLNIAKQRKSKNKLIIEKIIINIHKKIKYYATLHHESCRYIIPPLLEDTPLYDISNIIADIFKILDSEGYIVTAYSNGQLDINWNEKLVEQKVKTDSYLLLEQERKLKNITRKSKKIDERFAFLANPQKTGKPIKSIDEQLDEQVEKILKEKDQIQKKYAKMLI